MHAAADLLLLRSILPWIALGLWAGAAAISISATTAAVGFRTAPRIAIDKSEACDASGMSIQSSTDAASLDAAAGAQASDDGVTEEGPSAGITSDGPETGEAASEEAPPTTSRRPGRLLPVAKARDDGLFFERPNPDLEGPQRELKKTVAVNILLRSGYVSAARYCVQLAAPDDPYSIATIRQYKFWGRHKPAWDYEGNVVSALVPVSIRSKPDDPDATKQVSDAEGLAAQAWLLAMTVAAIEKSQRTELHRWTEWFAVSAIRLFHIRILDLSLGVAQIRPSTIERVAAKHAELAALLPKTRTAAITELRDERRSLKIAAVLLAILLKEHGGDPSAALAAFHGEAGNAFAPISYTSVGTEIFSYLDSAAP